MADELKFADIVHVGKAGTGLFKITPVQLGWKCADPSLPEGLLQVSGKDVEAASWQQACGRGKALLKLSFKGDGGMSRFAGFKSSDMRSLKAHLSKFFGVDLVEEAVSTNGWSWGDWKLDSDHQFQLVANGKLGLEVPLSEISIVSSQGPADLSVEFHEDDTIGANDEVLHEIRFFVQGGNDLGAESLRDDIMQRTGLMEKGEAVAMISDIALTAPRGKHDFEFFQQTVKVRGKTQTYTIKYKNIARLFLLELPDHNKITLVIGLDQPLRQGNQLHDFLVLNFEKDRMITTKVNLPEEKLKQFALVPGAPQKAVNLVAALLKDLSGKSIVTRNSDFKVDFSCARCNHKAQSGYLFPLKKSLIFIVKPVTWLRYDEIESIEFRTEMMRRNSFDMIVHLRGLPEVEFLQMEKNEFRPLLDCLTKVGVDIKNLRSLQSGTAPGLGERTAAPRVYDAALSSRRSSGMGDAADRDDDEEEDDEDFEDEDEEEDEDDDDGSDGASEESEKPAKRARKKT